MGSVSDCCVSDNYNSLRHDNEGITNTDKRSIQPFLPTNKHNNPSIYAKQPETDESLSNESNESNESYESRETDNEPEPQPETQPEPQKAKEKPFKNSKTDILINIPAPPVTCTNNKISTVPKANKINKKQGYKIIVTQPLSPTTKTQDHPYSKHKQRQRLLFNGYIRRYNITSTILFPAQILTLIFKFYYFHYADYNSQQSVLNDSKKREKSIKLITASRDKNVENLSQFLETILSSKLADKMWRKFDSDLKGVVETDKFIQFLILPVILYKSTLFHRQKKGEKIGKFDKKAIKHDVEHLAVWIICNFGERQIDNSFHFILTKHSYQNEFADFVDQYIQIHT